MIKFAQSIFAYKVSLLQYKWAKSFLEQLFFMFSQKLFSHYITYYNVILWLLQPL